jgi:methyltransferase (TIGR00027 family)
MDQKRPDGVGKTAVFSAWTRAIEGRRIDRLFHDPFAELVLSELVGDDWQATLADRVSSAVRNEEGDRQAIDQFSYFAVRTRYFDDRLLAALAGEVRQIVILAAGMDGRAWRLDWPTGTILYELDLPNMLIFKNAMVAKSTLAPHCERRTLAVDFNDDWQTPLLQAGFDRAAPTVWIAEGLLPYLTASECDMLVSTTACLSAPGSELLVEHNSRVMDGDIGKLLREAGETTGAPWKSSRDDMGRWLAGFGWDAEVRRGYDAAAEFGREVPEIPVTWLAHARRG